MQSTLLPLLPTINPYPTPVTVSGVGSLPQPAGKITFSKDLEIPILDLENAPPPRKIPENTRIKLLEHQPEYVIELLRDSQGFLSVPLEGFHWEPDRFLVYAFYAANENYQVTSVYYGVTENCRERLENYRALFANVYHNKVLAEKKLLEANPSTEKPAKPMALKWTKGVQFERYSRQVHRAMFEAAHPCWGVVTLPNSKTSMLRHEKIQIRLARRAVNAHKVTFEVLNVQKGSKRIGRSEVPSPIKPTLIKRKLNDEEHQQLKLRKLELEPEESFLLPIRPIRC